MLRYVALIWDEQTTPNDLVARTKRRALTTHDAWGAALETPGFALLCGKSDLEDIVTLTASHGLILGTLFAVPLSYEDTPVRITGQLDEDASALITATRGRSLIRTHWGSFVFIGRTRDKQGAIVLRSPMADLPCFWTSNDGLTTLFSFVEDGIDLRTTSISVNWDVIRAQSTGGDYLTNETAINDVYSLISGECLDIRERSIVRTIYWNPAAIRCENPVASLIDAARVMRQATQYCVNALTSRHDNLVLELSGGLDSSIILGCMSRAPSRPTIVSANIWSDGSGDERPFARSMAELTRTELCEIGRDPMVDVDDFPHCALTPNPVINFAAWDAEPALIRLARQRNATGIFTGILGDDLFGHSPAAENLAECLQTPSAKYGFARAAGDYAELTRVSLWRAMVEACRYMSWRSRLPDWSVHRYKQLVGLGIERLLVTTDVYAEYERALPKLIHPWFRASSDMPAGRTMLVWGAITATSTWPNAPFSSSDRGLFVNPLASQPLIEAFCRIPSRLHFHNAENGAVARKAFRLVLSAEVLNRGTGKGTGDTFLHKFLTHNQVALRELLFDGILVRENILDKQKLDAALSGAVSSSRIGVSEIMTQAYIELWLRSVSKLDSRAAGAWFRPATQEHQGALVGTQ